MNEGDTTPDQIQEAGANRLEARMGDHAAAGFQKPIREALATEDIDLQSIAESECILLEELCLAQRLGIMQSHGFYGDTSRRRLFGDDER